MTRQAGREGTGVGYQPRIGQRCACRPGVQRDNCPTCEGTGWVIDFQKLRARTAARVTKGAK